MQNRNSFIIAVHAGAGYHSKHKESEYKSACVTACLKASTCLEKGGSALDAVCLAISSLEDSPITNAGIGSSLTLDGTAECDASLMDGQSLAFGAVGALSGIRNPILVAQKLIQEQKHGNMSLGRIPPCTMVGSGAEKWAREYGLCTESPEVLLTDASKKTFENHKRRLEEAEHRRKKKRRLYLGKTDSPSIDENIQDTVGAVCIDTHCNMAAGVSSGGISLKQPGRLGPAALFGSGCWACNPKADKSPGVAVATSGTGEHLIKTLLAKQCADSLQQEELSENAISTVLKDKFIESEFLQGVAEKFGGILSLKLEKSDLWTKCELVWGHTTDSMCIGYATNLSKVKTAVSRLEVTQQAGKSYLMEGKLISL